MCFIWCYCCNWCICGTVYGCRLIVVWFGVCVGFDCVCYCGCCCYYGCDLIGGFCGFALLLHVVLVWLIVLSCFLALAVRVIGCCVFLFGYCFVILRLGCLCMFSCSCSPFGVLLCLVFGW